MAAVNHKSLAFRGAPPLAAGASVPTTIGGFLFFLLALVSPADVLGATGFFVTNHSNSVTGYAADANGNVAPATLIGGSNTGLNQPYGIAVDQDGSLYVANSTANSVTVYTAGSNGNVAPSVTIVGSSTGLVSPLGVAVDCLGFIYVANSGNNSVTVYSPGSKGNVTPAMTIMGAATGLKLPFGIALDSAMNVYVANNGNNSVTIYARGTNGNAAPTAAIVGAKTKLHKPAGLGLSPSNQIYVANKANNSVTVYAPLGAGTGNLNESPIAIIAGAKTKLSNPLGIAVDCRSGQIFVANQDNSSTTVYAASASGNVKPLATITGSKTKLKGPQGIALEICCQAPTPTPSPTPTATPIETATATIVSTPTPPSTIVTPSASPISTPPTPVSTSPAPTATATGSVPYAIQAAGLYVFNTATEVSSPQVIEYSTDTSSGATSSFGTVQAGTGLNSLTFAADGKHTYGLDSSGNIFGYSVTAATGALTSIGAPTAPPMGEQTATFIQAYGSSELWVGPGFTSQTNITLEQYPINGNGTLGSTTPVTLTGQTIQSFTPAGLSLPTAVWALTFGGSTDIVTLNVYPVNGDGTINPTSIQTIATPFLIQGISGGFAYGIGGNLGAQTLQTFALNSNGTLTANPSVTLPATTSFWNPVGYSPGPGGTLDLVESGNLAVYSVTSAGVIGSNPLQTIMLPATNWIQFPLSETVDLLQGPSFAFLPKVWTHNFSGTAIDVFPLNSDGTVGAMSGSVATGQGVGSAPSPPVTPGQPPFSYAIDSIASMVYGYQVDSSGGLTALGSFTPFVPSGQTLRGVSPFKPLSYSSAPVALFVYARSNSAGYIDVYSLGSTGMPANPTPLDTISIPPGRPESFLTLQSGQALAFPFGG